MTSFTNGPSFLTCAVVARESESTFSISELSDSKYISSPKKQTLSMQVSFSSRLVSNVGNEVEAPDVLLLRWNKLVNLWKQQNTAGYDQF